MIAACPGCGARYRVDAARVGSGGARVRCGRCEAVFRVEVPTLRGSHFLVADADAERAKQTEAFVSERGFEVEVVHDGAGALLNLVREPPAVAIFDESLPGVPGSVLCEVVKRTEVLSAIRVVLGVADEGKTAAASDGYYPDAVVAWDDLEGWLSKRLSNVESGRTAPAVAEVPVNPGAVTSEKSPDAGDPVHEERASAERLARIIVSDILLYDPDRFDQAARVGRLREVLAAELREGRALLERRVDPLVLKERDYLDEELMRVGRERGSPRDAD